jgi:hypothetical protein
VLAADDEDESLVSAELVGPCVLEKDEVDEPLVLLLAILLLLVLPEVVTESSPVPGPGEADAEDIVGPDVDISVVDEDSRVLLAVMIAPCG